MPKIVKNLRMSGTLLTLVALIVIICLLLCLNIRDRNYYKGAHYLALFSEASNSLQSNDLKNAEVKFRQAIALDGNRCEAYFGLGDVFLYKGETNAAVFNYEKGLIYCGTGPTNLLTTHEQLTERSFMLRKIELIKSNLCLPSDQKK